MVLDGVTVMFDTFLMSTTVGIVLLVAGSRSSGERSLLVWGGGYIAAAIATALYTQRGVIDDIWTIDIANALLTFAYGSFLVGARWFSGRRTAFWLTSVGGLIWLAACQLPAFHASFGARTVLMSIVACAYLFATCFVLFRIPERLPSKWPLIVLLAIHALVYLARLPSALLTPPPPGTNVVVTTAFLALALEGLVHLVASSILLVTMSMERSENRVQRLASTDALTGLSNRRDFLERAGESLGRARKAASVCTVLMIDIDHFKLINDVSGHEAGDEVLRSVARTLLGCLRPTDSCGRIGGEEFACCLPNCTAEQGLLVAERLRAAVHASQPVSTTISVGVADTGGASSFDVAVLMRAADRALYVSKREGRNRVTFAQAA